MSSTNAALQYDTERRDEGIRYPNWSIGTEGVIWVE